MRLNKYIDISYQKVNKAMSIYSGLPTRQDQRNYNNLLVRLLHTLQDHLIESTSGVIQTKYANKYQKIVAKMQSYEEHKYLPPKFSTILAPLIKSIYNSRAKVFEEMGERSLDKTNTNKILESVKEEEQVPSARETMMKNMGKSNIKKNHSEPGMNEEEKRYWMKQKNDHLKTRYSSGNRRSCSVFSVSKKKPHINQLKQDKSDIHLLTENQFASQTKKSQSFFKTRKTPLNTIHQKKKKIYLHNHQEHSQTQFNQSQVSHKRQRKTEESKKSIAPNEHKKIVKI